MAKPKSDTETEIRKGARGRLIVAAEAAAEERYDGAFDGGFRNLSFQLAFPTYEFSDAEAEDITAIDRKGDLGFDGGLVDETNRQVLLFQSRSTDKYTTEKLHDDVHGFVGSVEKLFSDAWLSKGHEDIRELAAEVRVALDEGYTCILKFTTMSKVDASIHETFEAITTLPGRKTAAQIEVLGEVELADRYGRLLLGDYTRSTDVHFEGAAADIHRPAASMIDVVYITIPVGQYVAECKPHEDALFRYNPRLFLGENTVTKGIVRTLQNDFESRAFHLLNNGVTAVCKDFVTIPVGDRWELDVVDFQVVNGCQTTKTLITRGGEALKDPSVLIDIKIVKAEGLRDRISSATNTQKAVSLEDSYANREEQNHIVRVLRAYSPKYFYFAKRGSWDQLSASKKREFQRPKGEAERGRYRKLYAKDLAQVCLAVFGQPASAKDKPRIAFEKRDDEDGEWYKRLFLPDNTAIQWILPFELYQYVAANVKNLEDDDRKKIGEYARYVLLYLVYETLQQRFDQPKDQFLDTRASEACFSTIDTWGPKLISVALGVVAEQYRAAQKKDANIGLREFFRSPVSFEDITDSMELRLKMLEETGSLVTFGFPDLRE